MRISKREITKADDHCLQLAMAAAHSRHPVQCPDACGIYLSTGLTSLSSSVVYPTPGKSLRISLKGRVYDNTA